MKGWDINVVRLPLNEASWLGYTCIDAAGNSHDPDPGTTTRPPSNKASPMPAPRACT